MRELNEIHSAIPQKWAQIICTDQSREPSTLQPCFDINNPNPGQPPRSILQCKTRNFYAQLHQTQKPVVPAIDYWKQTLQPEPAFNAKQWRTLYSPLITNKQGDVNWKIAHRVLPTALSLNRMGVYDTADCYRCGATDTVEHSIIECPTIDNFWNHVQTFVDKISNNNLPLTTGLKLLGKIPRADDPFGKRNADLINWTLTIARYAIHKSAVYHRVHNTTLPPEAIFAAVIKSHLRFQFKLYVSKHSQFYFPYDWCIGEAFAKVENNSLVFTF